MKKDRQKTSLSTNCPPGYHLVRAHSYRVPPSKKNPQGLVVTRHEHCAKNPPKKDILSRTQIQSIQKKFKKSPEVRKKIGHLKEFETVEQYDDLIYGWVEYWDKVLKPEVPLDPKLVKALIASESSFNPKIHLPAKKKIGKVHGLMQITDQTLGILKDNDAELKNHLLNITLDDLSDPSTNICAGVRWLFQKKKTAAARLKRTATWEDAVAEYKSYLKDMISGKNKNPRGMKIFRGYYNELQKSETSTQKNNSTVPA